MTTFTKQEFKGNFKGKTVNLFTLKSSQVEVGIIDYGATIVFLKVPDKNGLKSDVVTGFSDMQGYQGYNPYFGAVIGRVANRISNGKFVIDNKDYSLPINNGPNSIHGGKCGFDKKMWNPKVYEKSLILKLTSEDGEEGYPGELRVVVTYTLENDVLSIRYVANTTKPTPINLTNHSYFNLGGHDNWSNLSDHKVMIPSTRYLPTDENCLVTGKINEVEDTLFDIRQETFLTEELLNKLPGGGFDHNYCLPEDKKKNLAAIVKHATNGRTLKVETTQPGIQLYTGNFLNGVVGKTNVTYNKHSTFCLETQNWPNAVNVARGFPEMILMPTETYDHTTWFTFSSE